MTTGNKSVVDVRYGSTETYYARYRNHSGADGRTEVDANGNIVPKWNDYTMSFSETWAVRPYGTKCHYVSIPPFVPNASCGNLATPYCSLPEWTSFHDNVLLNKLATKVRGHSFNAGIALGEGKQTIELVVGTVTKLRRSFLKALQGEWDSVLRFGSRRRLTSEHVSSAYLQTVFGWLPLVNDVFEASKAFESKCAVRTNRFYASVKVEKSCESSVHPTAFTGIGTRRRRILYEMSENISVARSLGLTNPASVLWELTPWSFLFDYFMPIGTYLDNLAIIPRLRGRFLLMEKTEQRAVAIRPPPLYNAGGAMTDLYGSPNEKVAVNYSFSRQKTSALSVPAPSFRELPGALSGRRIYNVIALSHQQVLGFLKRRT